MTFQWLFFFPTAALFILVKNKTKTIYICTGFIYLVSLISNYLAYCHLNKFCSLEMLKLQLANEHLHPIEYLFVCCHLLTDERLFMSLFLFTFLSWRSLAVGERSCGESNLFFFLSPGPQSLLLQYIWMSQRQHNKVDWRIMCGIVSIDGSRGNRDGEGNLEGQWVRAKVKWGHRSSWRSSWFSMFEVHTYKVLTGQNVLF